MIVKTAENEIGHSAKWVHVVGTFDLVHQPGRVNVSMLICGRIRGGFHMMRHKKSKQQKQGLCQVHC